jgi:hypothetical protein
MNTGQKRNHFDLRCTAGWFLQNTGAKRKSRAAGHGWPLCQLTGRPCGTLWLVWFTLPTVGALAWAWFAVSTGPWWTDFKPEGLRSNLDRSTQIRWCKTKGKVPHHCTVTPASLPWPVTSQAPWRTPGIFVHLAWNRKHESDERNITSSMRYKAMVRNASKSRPL